MKRRAFTLIELIIVMAIISISFVVLVFRFSIIDKIGAESEIKTFVNDYSYARDKALSTGKDIEISFEGDSYTIKPVKYLYRDEIYTPKEEKKIIRELKYIEPIDINKITFYSNGYVLVNNTKEDHNFELVSKKDQQKYWFFTIQAVGGYLNEK